MSPLKKISLLVCLIPAVQLYGQDAPADTTEEKSVQKGKVLIGTYFDFSASSVNKVRINRPSIKSDVIQAGINVTFGKMLSDRWGLLVSAGFNQSTVSTPITNQAGNTFIFDEKNQSWSVAPSVRYYALIGDATYFFLQGTVLVSRGTAETDEFVSINNVVQLNFKTTGFGVGISPGISYFMTSKLSTEIAIGLLGYSIITGEDDQGNKTEANTFQSLLYLNSVSLGFVYYL